MNPPYSEDGAKERTLTALNHLNEKGTMAAVLPVGDQPEAWIGGEFVGVRSGKSSLVKFRSQISASVHLCLSVQKKLNHSAGQWGE